MSAAFITHIVVNQINFLIIILIPLAQLEECCFVLNYAILSVV